jgi:hypothetical protein
LCFASKSVKLDNNHRRPPETLEDIMKHAKTLRGRVSRGETTKLNARGALSIAFAAVFFAAIFSGCETDSDVDYDDLTPVLDRATRQYSIILPEPGERGGISASHASAKLGTTITVKYVPPGQLGGEEPAPAADESSYNITFLTGTYNNGQKTVKISKGGGGGMVILHARR